MPPFTVKVAKAGETLDIMMPPLLILSRRKFTSIVEEQMNEISKAY